MLSRKQASKV